VTKNIIPIQILRGGAAFAVALYHMQIYYKDIAKKRELSFSDVY
jgi:peptidoglycan/LPS O-acetylase OafA/YrhL